MRISIYITTLIIPIVMTTPIWASPSTSQTLDVKSLNQILQKKQVPWYGKENWLTRLPKSQLKKMMGLQDAPSDEVEFYSNSIHKFSQLPKSIDWREKDGANWVSPMLNQANCGSCVAFAAIGVLETQINIASLLPNLNVRLSPQHLFACGGASCEMGWNLFSATLFLQNKGVVDEACMPYTSGASGQDVACNTACRDAKQRTFKIANYSCPTKGIPNLEAVKEALQKGPLMTSMIVYEDFMYYAGGIYKHTTGAGLGGHAISIIGYDDVTESLIIRNSWGPDWGENGFAHISYSDKSGIGLSTWAYEVPSPAGAIRIVSPQDYDYFSGQVRFQAESTFAKTQSLEFNIYNTENKILLTQSCESQNTCHTNVDTLTLSDGKYFLEVLAHDQNKNLIGKSSQKLFYVVNQTPKLSLKFKGMGSLDLNKPLSDRIEFDITTSSSSVPMSSLEFHYKDTRGIEKTKSTKVVLNKMLMGWKTNLVADGPVEIWMVGKVDSHGMSTFIESRHLIVTVDNSTNE